MKSLQYQQVETFGSMEREEKVQFILEQMRLGLARKDYIRTQIISKKISIKFFNSAESDIVQVSCMCACIDLHYDCLALHTACINTVNPLPNSH